MLNRIKAILPKGKFGRSVSVLAGGTAISQALGVLAAPILTRIYTTQDFGNFQVYFSIISLGIVLAGWRYEVAIMLPEDENVAANLLAVTLGIVCLMSLLAAGLSGWAHFTTLSLGNAEALRPYMWIFPLAICGAGTYQALSYWAFRHKSFSQVSGTKVLQIGSQIVTQLTLGGIFHIGLLGLLIGDAFARANGSIGLAKLAWHKSRPDLKSISVRGMWTAALRYRNFPLISAFSALLSTGGAAVPMLIVAQFYGIKVVGWLALADRVMGVPSTLIGQAVSQVYMTEAAPLVRSDPEGLRLLFRATIKKLVWLPLAPCLIILVAGPTLFAFVFGEPWREAGNYARLLVLMQYITFVAWPFTPTLTLLEHQGQQFALDAARLGLTLGCIWLASSANFTAREAVVTYGVTSLLGYVAVLIFSSLAIDKRVQKSTAVLVEV
ncbi:MAG: hypothetical protein JWN45_2696 [Acidobacteriaceae bacterium]|nr:hypothetical protein [Acidobacteriaceae bacterium]